MFAFFSGELLLQTKIDFWIWKRRNRYKLQSEWYFVSVNNYSTIGVCMFIINNVSRDVTFSDKISSGILEKFVSYLVSTFKDCVPDFCYGYSNHANHTGCDPWGNYTLNL